MNNNLVSIIIPTRNESKNINRCLLSCQKQDYKNIEMIIVDNFSTDGTVNIAKKFTKNIYLKGTERSQQRNHGASKASGKYLLFVDADMELDKGLVKNCVQLAEEHDYQAIFILEKIPPVDFWSRCRDFEKSLYWQRLLFEAPRFIKSDTFKAIEGYDQKLIASEDWDLTTRLVNKKVKLGYSDKHLIHHEGPISLISLAKKKFYYGLSLKMYFQKHPRKSIFQYNPVREAYLKNIDKLIANPLMFASLMVLKTVEYIAGGLGFVIGFWKK